MNRISLLLVLDLGLLLLVVVLKCLNLTGIALHEWLGFALCPLVLLHVVLQWSWFTAQFRRVSSPGAWRPRINSFLNLSLLFVMAGTLVSGVLVSNQVMPLVGESLGRIQVWKWVHDSLNSVLLALVGLHVALNWNWLMAAMRRRRPALPADKSSAPKKAASLTVSRRTGFPTLIGRGLVVLAISGVAAMISYAIFVPIAGPPRGLERSQYRDNTLGGATQAPTPALPRERERPISLAKGFGEIVVVLLGLFVAIIAGRYLFRLRL